MTANDTFWPQIVILRRWLEYFGVKPPFGDEESPPPGCENCSPAANSRWNEGFTLVEAVVSLAIAGMLMVTLAAAISFTLSQVPKEGAKLSVENRHELARYWLTRDANSARTYSTGTSPTYGTFSWSDYSGSSLDSWQVTYSYDSTLKALIRQDQKNSVVQSTFQIAADILQYSAVSFSWSASQRKVTVTITPTIEEALAVGDVSRTATLVAFLRYEAEPAVSPPQLTPVPTPVPGSVTYYVAANPTLITGTYVSGDATSLNTIDSSFYTVASVTVGGSKQTSWETFSQTIADPAPVSQFEVRFTGQSTSINVSVNIFTKVGASSSYSPTPDFGFTFTNANTNEIRSYFFSAAQLTTLNGASSKVVYVRVDASASPTFNLKSDQLIFIASP